MLLGTAWLVLMLLGAMLLGTAWLVLMLLGAASPEYTVVVGSIIVRLAVLAVPGFEPDENEFSILP
jgi:hypothetical protein